MRWLAFAKRNTLEIVRDPLTVGFGLGFPLILLLLLNGIQSRIPIQMFVLESLVPGIVVFGYSFISLFSALLVSKDRESALFARVQTTPMTAAEFILGYMLPMLPIAIAQSIICCIAAGLLGMSVTITCIFLCAGSLPMVFLYIGLGLLLGTVLTDKQVGGICGALLTNLSAWLSGVWFDIDLLGEGLSRFAHLLPFIHGVELGKALLAGNFSAVFPHIYWVMGWALICCSAAVIVFRRKMDH